MAAAADRKRSESVPGRCRPDPAALASRSWPVHRSRSTSILPCLDEAAALPWVLPRVPPGTRRDRGRQRLDRRVGRDRAARTAPTVVRAEQTRLRRGLPRRAARRARRDRGGDGRRRQPRPAAAAPASSTPVRDGDVDLVIGARRPVTRRAQPWQLRLANRALRRPEPAPDRGAPARPRSDASRPAGRTCWRSACRTGGRAIRPRPWSARPTPAGGSARCGWTTGRGTGGRR